MAGNRAPKQWSLTKHETITAFEAWRHNLQYTLSLDPNFAPYLIDGVTWSKKTTTAPLRGLEDDAEPIPEAQRRTAAQKATQLELLLGQIANYLPCYLSQHYIVKNSTSLSTIWQAIRAHFGFQSTGAHITKVLHLFSRLQMLLERLHELAGSNSVLFLTSFIQETKFTIANVESAVGVAVHVTLQSVNT